jgi:hypothetical protein
MKAPKFPTLFLTLFRLATFHYLLLADAGRIDLSWSSNGWQVEVSKPHWA